MRSSMKESGKSAVGKRLWMNSGFCVGSVADQGAFHPRRTSSHLFMLGFTDMLYFLFLAALSRKWLILPI